MKTEKTPNSKCRVCGKEFHAKPSHLKRGWGRHCSKECRDKGLRTGKFVACAYCGKKVYKILADLRRKSKTGRYFCNNSCHCAWKNKQRRKKKNLKSLSHLLWRPWCNSSTRVCGTLGEDASSSGLPIFFLKFLGLKKKKTRPVFFKRPLKKVLYDLYWKEHYMQTEIAEIFNVTHTSVKRWLNYYKIPVKSRTLSCGHNLNSRKNLDLGCTKESQRKSAKSRTIYSREKLIKKIEEFVQKEGRVPTKNEFIKNSLYPDYVTYRDYFGTWNNAIKIAGYNPNQSWFSPKNFSKDLRAKDGHLCNSVSEIIIDDWLFKNEISHERECLYPEGRYRCDFVIEGIFIEFFGLANASIDLRYPIIMEKKKKMCKKYKIFLIELYEKDLYNLEQSLGKKLKKIKEKTSVPTIQNLISYLSKSRMNFFKDISN